jgi:hypothetical protein
MMYATDKAEGKEGIERAMMSLGGIAARKYNPWSAHGGRWSSSEEFGKA